MSNKLKHIIREEIRQILNEAYISYNNGVLLTGDDGYKNQLTFKFAADPGNVAAKLSGNQFYAINVRGTIITSPEGKVKYYKIKSATVITKKSGMAWYQAERDDLIKTVYTIKNHALYQGSKQLGIFSDVTGEFVDSEAIDVTDIQDDGTVRTATSIAKDMDILWGYIVKNLHKMKQQYNHKGHSYNKYNIEDMKGNAKSKPGVANPGYFMYQNILKLYRNVKSSEAPILLSDKTRRVVVTRIAKFMLAQKDADRNKLKAGKSIALQIINQNKTNLTIQQMYMLLGELQALKINHGHPNNFNNLRQIEKMLSSNGSLKKNLTNIDMPGWDDLSGLFGVNPTGFKAQSYLHNIKSRDGSTWTSDNSCFGANFNKNKLKLFANDFCPGDGIVSPM